MLMMDYPVPSSPFFSSFADIVPNGPIIIQYVQFGYNGYNCIFRYLFWHLLYNTNYSDPYLYRNPVYSIPVVPKSCPRLFYHR